MSNGKVPGLIKCRLFPRQTSHHTDFRFDVWKAFECDLERIIWCNINASLRSPVTNVATASSVLHQHVRHRRTCFVDQHYFVYSVVQLYAYNGKMCSL